MSGKTVTLRLRHPETDDVLTLTLPESTRFGALNEQLLDSGFVYPQKPGYAFLVGGHLCSAGHCLRDYLPDGADTLDVRIFGIPQIMV